jgi:hypothetical protein
MTSPPAERMILVEVLELTATFEQFHAAVTSALQRLEKDGLRALNSVQVNYNPESNTVGIVLVIDDYAQLTDHIQMISTWDEFHRFATTVKLTDIRVYGKLSAEAKSWLTRDNVPLKAFPDRVSGFIRPSPAQAG